uniref:Type II secretion system protein (FlaJ-A, flaJ) n=1 Tax=uncultured marine group II/III euryarchaeote KM3_109_G01 TaxID=1457850 RepID=A0A075GBH5_9EURY|nr:type II secretion system protein (flaJ-A, flaJ) [uncultured marine group II/III euryarchaeote KM3_109_G01]
MARRKKKLRVDLDLPKDDNPQQTMTAILSVSMFLGIILSTFWILNTDLVLNQPNGNMPFVNMACGFDGESPLAPTYSQNESCWLLKEKPQPGTWGESWLRVDPPGQVQFFDIPGMEPIRLGGAPHPPQTLELQCTAKAARAIKYTVSIYAPNSTSPLVKSPTLFANSEGCELEFPNVQPEEDYELWLEIEPGQEQMTEFTFKVTVMAYDGIPENMNNKSFFIGPQLLLGGKDIRPFLFVNFFAYGFLVAVFPAAIFWDRKAKAILAVEDKFPDFLRDLAEYWKGGLSMTLAVRTLANSEYGALNDDIKKMSDQISWGVAFQDVLELFANRVGTPLVKRAVSLIGEANKAGGKISDILVTAANDSREIKFLQAERARAIASYIMVIWVSYMVFMGVIVVLSKVFIPAIATSNDGEGGDSSQSIGNMKIRAIDPLFFLVVFFYGVTIQALGNGAMAGLMATGRLSSGMKHAGYMMILAIISFNFVAFAPELIGVPPSPFLNPSIGTYTPGG